MWIALVRVAPYTGAWIEIISTGLRISQINVAPYTGAWIEMCKLNQQLSQYLVAPYTGAWIEIQLHLSVIRFNTSHPTRVRGLKYSEG